MIVSWNWLSQYVDLDMDHDTLVDRLTMSGLNHEGTESVGADQAIDLEVTSNRPDCLGHLGVAREIATLFGLELHIPEPAPPTGAVRIDDICQVKIESPRLCPRYTARLIRGVRIGPSPDWLVQRLQAIGVTPINNVVDATNFVMFECGQPLHAFDFAKVADGMIIIRQPRPGEAIEAIDHHTYALQPGMCLIADAENPIAIGGVMGGADSEIDESTVDVLIESATFDPMAIRNTARTLNLHSPSSFRFERATDPAQVDWASRRCCEIILETAGGELLDGVIDVGTQPDAPDPIRLRWGQLQRVLGIEIPSDFAQATLQALGLKILESDTTSVVAVPPSWRSDLTREVDLVEEVGRIHGYDKIPDDAVVPLAASVQTPRDRVVDKVTRVLNGAGFDEAITASFVPEPWSNAFSPWTDQPPLVSSQPMLGVLEKASQNIGAVDMIRRSLVPSLLEARRINEYRSNPDIELFEIAKVYLSRGENQIPDQPTMACLVSQRDFFSLKGVVQGLVHALNPACDLTLKSYSHDLLDPNLAGELYVGERRLGFIGQVSAVAREQFGLRHDASVAELELESLEQIAVLIPLHHDPSPFPAVSRDFNFILADEVRWSALETVVRKAAEPLLESIHYRETFRDETRDGAGNKRILLSIMLRSDQGTLTGDQVDEVSQRIVQACQNQLDATLVG